MIAGTFDPWTNGHHDVLRAAVDLFDVVYVALLTNPDKQPLFNTNQRMEMVRLAIMDDPILRMAMGKDRLSILVRPDEPAVHVAAQNGALWMVRGLRLSMEYEKELGACLVNAVISDAIQTIYIPPQQEHIHISSSVVRQMINLRLDGPILTMVPGIVYRQICDICRLNDNNTEEDSDA